jgi:hypothetical protein
MVRAFGGVLLCEKALWFVPKHPRIKKKINKCFVFIDLAKFYSPYFTIGLIYTPSLA